MSCASIDSIGFVIIRIFHKEMLCRFSSAACAADSFQWASQSKSCQIDVIATPQTSLDTRRSLACGSEQNALHLLLDVVHFQHWSSSIRRTNMLKFILKTNIFLLNFPIKRVPILFMPVYGISLAKVSHVFFHCSNAVFIYSAQNVGKTFSLMISAKWDR